MKSIRILFQLFLLVAFLAGIYFIMYNKKDMETLMNKRGATPEQDETSGCPNLLVRKGNVILLYNTNLPIIENKNPLPFYNLDEYINYLEIQKRNGISCPVLFLQQENNVQGQFIYRVRPNPFDLQGGLPTTTNLYKEDTNGMPVPVPVIDANRANKPYNQNNYAGFDPLGLHIGTYTDLDKIHDSTKLQGESDNPMDTNWGGVSFTQHMIDIGKYEENNITKPVLFQPRGYYDPSIPTGFSQPKDII
jgi:hypothetical protein